MDGTPMRNFIAKMGRPKFSLRRWTGQSSLPSKRLEQNSSKGLLLLRLLIKPTTEVQYTKLGMETVTKNDIDTSNPTLVKHVKVAILALKAEHPQIQLSHANETKMIKAIETLTYVQKNGYVQARKIVMGYEVSCQFPF
jgi:hypothetical protein